MVGGRAGSSQSRHVLTRLVHQPERELTERKTLNGILLGLYRLHTESDRTNNIQSQTVQTPYSQTVHVPYRVSQTVHTPYRVRPYRRRLSHSFLCLQKALLVLVSRAAFKPAWTFWRVQ